MNKKILTVASSVVALALPFIALADFAQPGFPGILPDAWTVINKILNFIWPLFIGIAVIMFLYSGFLFLAASGDPTKIKEARNSLLYGIIGVVVGILAFSLPLIIKNTLGV